MLAVLVVLTAAAQPPAAQSPKQPAAKTKAAPPEDPEKRARAIARELPWARDAFFELRREAGKIEDPALNQRAAELAARHGLPGGAGSDAHDPDGIGAAYLEMPDFDGPRDFLTQLAVAEITGEHRRHAVRYARRRAAPG